MAVEYTPHGVSKTIHEVSEGSEKMVLYALPLTLALGFNSLRDLGVLCVSAVSQSAEILNAETQNTGFPQRTETIRDKAVNWK